MKNLVLGFALVLPLIFVVSAANAADGAGLSDQSVKYIGYFFAMAIAAFGGTAAQSAAASSALEGMARNPSAADKLFVPMILALALMESLVIFTLITVFLV
ncbi:MAG: F0F1 ATP synthase subunit C [Bdellovibrionales bacterium CG12_big_fil_rev_8_21_14_0_65_38_15]|nr:F0F1 ATP synthase subunit C [Halobacteriovorax sp.]PIP91195.1 MAG: F0F1 ATP synthase subunit C [Bdellovibrionales bacterium CG22_combo_CG10-13_8_21_14_all_38_13]PIQ55975.1 MAG: F0F1 ATP synthase subunit C [Bdellovibrionales bacterium CG12_big_fil_rev_8_21_14_0_65_38_15]PIR30580.1 MAG: F0F1 ATP synthase subunit C [Bdellovibrionales bacterium CG11_big_fil_rev_8_21_14_0_20_38_13]|tara:strand:- start:6610 stop:6912 length:303 start_codon:yes stop_codon:yes gene_type:complete